MSNISESKKILNLIESVRGISEAVSKDYRIIEQSNGTFMIQSFTDKRDTDNPDDAGWKKVTVKKTLKEALSYLNYDDTDHPGAYTLTTKDGKMKVVKVKE